MAGKMDTVRKFEMNINSLCISELSGSVTPKFCIFMAKFFNSFISGMDGHIDMKQYIYIYI